MIKEEKLSANIKKLCDRLQKYCNDQHSYTKAADTLSNKWGLTLDTKEVERLAKGKSMDRFIRKLILLLNCCEQFEMDLISGDNLKKSLAEEKLDQIKKIVME